jgi:hypothetical protein
MYCIVVHHWHRVDSAYDSCRVVQPTPDAQKPVGRTHMPSKLVLGSLSHKLTGTVIR